MADFVCSVKHLSPCQQNLFFFLIYIYGGEGVQEAGSLSFGWAPVTMIYGEDAEFKTLHLPNASNGTAISELAIWSPKKTTAQ